FFFQAEDGIRDFHVTGVQTCALPILAVSSSLFDEASGRERLRASIGQIHYFDAPRVGLPGAMPDAGDNSALVADLSSELSDRWQIGRASCRERVYISAVAPPAIRQQQ